MSKMNRRNFLQFMSMGVASIGLGCLWPRWAEAAVPWAKILSIVSGVGTVATTTKDVVDAIQAVKGLLSESAAEISGPTPEMFERWHPPRMQPFRPRISDTFAGGRQWLPELQELGAQFGNPWVPGHTQGLPGIDLTGIWSDLQYPSVQTYIRQFGAYLNVIAGIGDVPAVFGEGLFDPSHSVVHVIGQNRAGIRPLTNLQWRQS